MERLWSPWRLAYVSGADNVSREGTCVFCDGSERVDHDLVLVRGRASYVILNLYPYNNGHVMVVPNRHIASLADATSDELNELMRLTRDAELALREVYDPQGVNVGINIGRAAGAGIVEHLHIHLVPRWTGDTNFMSVVGAVRVVPEDLHDTARRMKPVLERLAAGHTR